MFSLSVLIFVFLMNGVSTSIEVVPTKRSRGSPKGSERKQQFMQCRQLLATRLPTPVPTPVMSISVADQSHFNDNYGFSRFINFFLSRHECIEKNLCFSSFVQHFCAWGHFSMIQYSPSIFG